MESVVLVVWTARRKEWGKDGWDMLSRPIPSDGRNRDRFLLLIPI